MATPRTGRPPGRPKGSKTKVYRPHAEKLMALSGRATPKDVLLNVMWRHYRARRYDEAARVASLVAPFVHPRLSSSTVEVKPSLREMLLQATDEELAAFAEEADAVADLAKADLARTKPRGSA